MSTNRSAWVDRHDRVAPGGHRSNVSAIDATPASAHVSNVSAKAWFQSVALSAESRPVPTS